MSTNSDISSLSERKSAADRYFQCLGLKITDFLWLFPVFDVLFVIVFVFIDQYSRLSCCFFLFVSSFIPSVLFHSLYFMLFISLCHFLFICYLTFYLSHWFLLRSVSVLPLPPSTSVQFVSGWTPTSLSSSGMTTSF